MVVVVVVSPPYTRQRAVCSRSMGFDVCHPLIRVPIYVNVDRS